VLVDQGVSDAAERVRKTLAAANIDAKVERTRANLEDVFVAATLPKANEDKANEAAKAGSR
jgi:hypothetical protein